MQNIVLYSPFEIEIDLTNVSYIIQSSDKIFSLFSQPWRDLPKEDPT